MSGRMTVLLTVGVAFVLWAIFTLSTSVGPAPAETGLTLKGYASAEQLDAEAARPISEPAEPIMHPIDRVIITRDGIQMALVRSPTGALPLWRLAHPVAGPARAGAVEQIIQAFKTDRVAIQSTKFSPGDASLFGLKTGTTIGLELRADGARWNRVSLLVGRTETTVGSDGAAQSDTWVALSSAPNIAHRLPGVDLRALIDFEANGFREQRLMPWPSKSYATLVVTRPDGSTVSDGLATMGSAFATLRAVRFIALKDGPTADALAQSWTFEGTLKTGEVQRIQIAAAPFNAAGERWAKRGALAPDEWITLSAGTAKVLLPPTTP